MKNQVTKHVVLYYYTVYSFNEPGLDPREIFNNVNNFNENFETESCVN